MDRVVLIVGAVAIAGVVALLLGRRRPAPTNPAAHVPGQLDRRDFTRPLTPWLIAVFTSEACSTCAAVWAAARGLDSSRVAVQELEVSRDRPLHRRYAIDSVPVVVIADDEGVVRHSFLGPVDRAELHATVTSVTG